MVRPEEAKSAAGDLLSAALLGQGWAEALERLASAAEAGGASVVRVRGGRPVAHLSSTGWAEAEAEVLAGRTATSPRQFYPDHVYGCGFCPDHEVWNDDELRRDRYYQEFLRPHDVFFHAKLRLYAAPGERLTLTLKRRLRLGPYEPADIAVLDSVAAELRTTARIGRHILDAEASGVVELLQQRGGPVFELDAFGRVLRVRGRDAESCGLLVRGRRLVAVDRLVQPRLGRAIAAALTSSPRPALAAITDQRGRRAFLQIVPVTGAARDVFLATAAVAVVIEPSPHPKSDGVLADGVREALGLTSREAEIARLLAEGLSLTEIAERLRMRTGTARNHLKSVFEKSGARRQGELVALLCKLKF